MAYLSVFPNGQKVPGEQPFSVFLIHNYISCTEFIVTWQGLSICFTDKSMEQENGSLKQGDFPKV